MEASRLLWDAKQEDEKLTAWPSLAPHRSPCMSYSLQMMTELGSTPLYPKRIDIYYDTTRATICNSWRLARVQVLTVISKTAELLSTSSSSSYTLAVSLSQDQQQAEDRVREYIDDLCSSVHFIMSQRNTKEISTHYPHEPGAATISDDPGPELIC
jgi:hypothetical protein